MLQRWDIGTALARGFRGDVDFPWPLERANDLFELKYGRALVENDRRSGKVPVYGTNGQCGWHDTPLFQGPGVILGRKGQGHLGVEWSDDDYWVIDTAYSLQPLTDRIDLRYAYFLLKYVGLNHLKDGTSNPSLSRSSFGAQIFPLPSLSEQRAIALILRTLDDKIELNCEVNETLEEMARALFKSWFVDFDKVRAKTEGRRREGIDAEMAKLFPSEFEGDEPNQIPAGWATRSLYDSAKYINGAAYRDFDFSAERKGLPIIKIAELKSGITPQTKFTEGQVDEKYRIDTGSVLFSWSGNPDTSIDTFVWTQGPAWLNQHIFKVEPKVPEERFFVFYLLKHLRPIFADIARNKQTTGLGHVTAADMKRMSVVHPPKTVLDKFNKIVAPVYDRWFANLLEISSLQAIRDTVLPKLLSGELRIENPDAFLKEHVP